MTAVIVIILGALLLWGLYLAWDARQTANFSVTATPDEVGTFLADFYGKTWRKDGGPGKINVTPKLRANAPTLSIDWESADQGGSTVGIWVSQARTRMGIVLHPLFIWRKKRKLRKRLTAAFE